VRAYTYACRQQLDGLEQDFLAISDLLFNLHYGPALEQLGATQLDAETLLAFTKESVEEVTVALGCCAKRQAKPRRDADADDLTVENGGDSGFVFRVLAMAVAFFGTIFCVQVGAGFLACNHLLLSVSRLAPHLIIANARAVLVVFTIAVVRVGGEHKQRKT
jgi:hypothetical protein